jgi:methylenetetrahydrofolate dehydrogenase (NADP+)/methenyltetrahydrofolate cyclohydrolase
MNMYENKIIDGKLVSAKIITEIKSEVARSGIKPGLALILVGNDPASEIYVNMKSKMCAELGYYSIIQKLPQTAEESDVLKLISGFNENRDIHGILVQCPLPKHLSETKILESVSYLKDIDGLHPINTGRLFIGQKCFVPCTPAGIIELLKHYNIETTGKDVVVIGRSNLVGKPVAGLLMQKNKNANATVTVCHSSSKNIPEHTRLADIIITAMGKAKFLKPDMIKEGSVIIDVGTNRIEDKTAKRGFRLVGDVDFDECVEKVSMISPVPGGVGPMTIAMLMKNTLMSAQKLIYN